MWLRDTGALERMKDGVMRPPDLIPYPRARHNQPLILSQLGIIMIIQVAGLLIGTITFFVELLTKPKLNNAPNSGGVNPNNTSRGAAIHRPSRTAPLNEIVVIAEEL